MWEELGIAPSDDPKTIRRAYAARLKRLDPDREPEAFARLRAALEWALASAGRSISSSVSSARPSPSRDADTSESRTKPSRARTSDDLLAEQPSSHQTEDKIEPVPGPPGSQPQSVRRRHEWLDSSAPDRALLIALETALGRGDASEATRLYYRAAATGAIPLQTAPQVLDRLFAVALEDRKLDPAVFRELARCFGWDQPPHRDSGPSELRDGVAARLGAEAWYDSQVAAADKVKGTTRRQAKVARLILGRTRRPWAFRIDRAALKARLEEYRTHEKWLAGRIDPVRAGDLEQRLRRREIRSLMLYGFFLAVMLGNAMRVYILEANDNSLELWQLLAMPVLMAFLLWVLILLLRHLIRLTMPSMTERPALQRARAAFGRWRPKRPRDMS